MYQLWKIQLRIRSISLKKVKELVVKHSRHKCGWIMVIAVIYE